MNYWWVCARINRTPRSHPAQRYSFAALGVDADGIYVDHGPTGTNRGSARHPVGVGACHTGDTLMVTKLDRLAMSLPDAQDILDG